MYKIYNIEFKDGKHATMLTDLNDGATLEGARASAIERFGERRLKEVTESEYQKRLQNDQSNQR